MAAIILLIGIAAWWAVSAAGDRKNPLNKAEAFSYREDGLLYWFEAKSRSGKVKGNLHQMKVIEEIGKPPFLEEKHYRLSGKETNMGYEFKVNEDGKTRTYTAAFTGSNLMVHKKGEEAAKAYRAVGQKEIEHEVKEIQQEYEYAVYHSEEKEKARLRKFFSDLNQTYGFLHSADNGSYWLFLKIDEALLQGELSGSLLMLADTGNPNSPYEETNYPLNGITDGQMLRLYTKIDGKQTMLEGNFKGDATTFDLSFWLAESKLPFKAVTEKEYKQAYSEFKTNAQKRQ
ncbi:hypothetical protein [Bacillus sp. FJAT-27245]|uniref:hypothetical protein n=1 Tax=Bacillus sp. FJAT-27245 TaxID=1684144 RepID=UPI000A4C897A|nr:hypothetical protein [Bacillus sp. FJAT-27245]